MHSKVKASVLQSARNPSVDLALVGMAAAIGVLMTPQVSHAQEEAQETVVVTGSRIERRDFSAPSPILTIDAETLEQSSTLSVESVLNQFPQFIPDGTQFSTAEVEPSAFTSPGISNVNLRGLGSNRNLVLVNGRRVQPANATLVVDVSTIPSAAIRSVEAISGGASSVYGADAISGVVNFVLRDDFEGIDIDLETTNTDQGGGQETRVSALIGGNLFGDRGNVMFGGEWTERRPVYQRQRDFIVEGWLDPGTTAGAVSETYWTCTGFTGGGCPTQAAVDTVYADVAPIGTVSPTTTTYLNDDGTVFQATGPISYTGELGPERKVMSLQNDTLGEVNTRGYASSPLERYSLFGRAIYDVADNIRIFLQGNFSQFEVDSIGPLPLAIAGNTASIPHGTDIYAPSVGPGGVTLPQYVSGGAAGLDCPAMGGCTNSQAFPTPPELNFLLDQRGGGTQANNNWPLQRYMDFMPARTTNNQSTVYQLQMGAEGALTSRDWTWEAYVSHGRTTVDNYLVAGYLSAARWDLVATSPNYGRGLTYSGSQLGSNISCESGLPLLEEFTPSDDCVQAISAYPKQYTRVDQTIVEANLQGGLIDMAAGQLRFAAGVSRRQNDAIFEPDPLIQAESVLDSVIGIFPQNETRGSTTVEEIYGELLVPVADRLNVEFGYRNSDFDLEGSVDTYKALFDWAATDWIRLRGGRQIANRAPNIAELFTGPSQNVVGFQGGDPCLAITLNEWGNHPDNPNRAEIQALCSEIINAPVGAPSDFDLDPDNYGGIFPFNLQLELENTIGNPDVKSEEAETYTLGAVIELSNWTASVDFYQIDIKGAIGVPSAREIYRRCFNDYGTNPGYSIDDPEGACRRIVRDPITGYRVQVDVPYSNLGALKTSGVDMQMNWTGSLASNSVYVNFIATLVDEYKIQEIPGGVIYDYAGTLGAGGQFDYRTYTTFGVNLGDGSLGLRWTHLPEIENGTYATNPQTTILPTGSYNRIDLFGNWRVSDSTVVRFGIDNLFDSDPNLVGVDPGVNNARGSTNGAFYDILGRRFYVGVSMNL